MSATWTMKIELYSGSFDGLKCMAKSAFDKIESAKSVKGLPIALGGGAGRGDPMGFGYNVTYTCPIEDRIANLRKEADDLEASLKS